MMATQPKIEPLEWPAELERGAPPNTSGFIPIDLRVLVKPDPVKDRTAGGIILANAHVEREEHATDKGVLVAVGVNAWSEASRANGFVAPQPGQRVAFAKYGGRLIEGADGEKYRIMNDEDVIAKLED
jgi:chaperonin GroES